MGGFLFAAPKYQHTVLALLEDDDITCFHYHSGRYETFSTKHLTLNFGTLGRTSMGMTEIDDLLRHYYKLWPDDETSGVKTDGEPFNESCSPYPCWTYESLRAIGVQFLEPQSPHYENANQLWYVIFETSSPWSANPCASQLSIVSGEREMTENTGRSCVWSCGRMAVSRHLVYGIAVCSTECVDHYEATISSEASLEQLGFLNTSLHRQLYQEVQSHYRALLWTQMDRLYQALVSKGCTNLPDIDDAGTLQSSFVDEETERSIVTYMKERACLFKLEVAPRDVRVMMMRSENGRKKPVKANK